MKCGGAPDRGKPSNRSSALKSYSAMDWRSSQRCRRDLGMILTLGGFQENSRPLCFLLSSRVPGCQFFKHLAYVIVQLYLGWFLPRHWFSLPLPGPIIPYLSPYLCLSVPAKLIAR